MPRELKKRGRREEKKRKGEDLRDSSSPKRVRTDETPYDIQEQEQEQRLEVHGDVGDDFISFNDPNDVAPLQQEQFYGLLSEDEQSYYTNVNNKLSANDFESNEDRVLFIEAVHRETHGKELKVASGQSCSRYLEKIILLSTPAQIKSLFHAFLENLTYLVQHRFGSHCCEALFLQAAKHVSLKEVANDEDLTMESLFLQAVEQLKPNIGFLVTDRFATHTVRVLLLVLSGEPLDEASSKLIASRKKEKIELPEGSRGNGQVDTKRKVPQSFKYALKDVIASAVSTLDTTYIRALATHPTGNPFLQLALRLELSSNVDSKERTNQILFQKLFPDRDLEVDSDSGKFITGLIYDPTGSHLVEILVRHLPGKTFKKLYGNLLKERMRSLARNDVASYIAIRVIERLGKDDLDEVQQQLRPEISTLISNAKFGLLKTLFERITVRDSDPTLLSSSVRAAYSDENVHILPRMLSFNNNTNSPDTEVKISGSTMKTDSSMRTDLHGSLLAQTMLNTPVANELIQESILAQSTSDLILMAKDSVASRVLQVALSSEQSSTKFRRQLVPKFYGAMADLAQDVSGSYLADALWGATANSHFMKERLARELAENETILRESVYGRTVWRNWCMDIYQRRPGEWQAIAKGRGDDTVQEADKGTKKTAIQLARERHAKARGIRGPDSHSRTTTSVLSANA